jgi:putative zinc finger/helix-turn-helix YgiT family protein
MAERSGLQQVLCWNCRTRTEYTIKSRKSVRVIKGTEYTYHEQYAVCNTCGEEVMVPGLSDANEHELDNLYRRNHGLITIDDIYAILKKYNIEKRPLSNLLGFGELTITRYLDGQLPSRRYSDLLLLVLNDENAMREILYKNKSNITEKAFQKSMEAITEREHFLDNKTKTELIAMYVIKSSYEVTNLSLQKLLYYIKVFGFILLKKDVLNESCEAWVHGPVFPDVYEKYKKFGREVISNEELDICFENLLSSEEMSMIDYVLKNFGIYNGSILREFTHKEQPWKNARHGLNETDRCRNKIYDEDIQNYFYLMDKEYGLHKKDGVHQYIKSLNVL